MGDRQAGPATPRAASTASWWTSRGLLPGIARAVVFALGYLLLGWVSRLTVVEPIAITPVWLGSALAAVCVARLPARTWPSLLAGLVAAEAVGEAAVWHVGVAATVAFTAANALEGLLAGLLLRWTGAVRLRRPRDLGGLATSAVVAAGVAGIVVGLVAVLIDGTAFVPAWGAYLLGDATGIIVLGPLLLLHHPTLPTSRARWLELGVVTGITVVLTLAVFAQPLPAATTAPLQLLLVPVLAWAGVRFGMTLVSVLAPFVLVVGLWQTAHGDGPFVLVGVLSEGILVGQFFVVSFSLAVFAVALLEEDRARAERRDRESRSLVDQILENTPAMVFVKSYDGRGPDGRYALVNRRFSDAIGLPDDQLVGRTESEVLPRYSEGFNAEDREVLASDRPAVYEGSTEREGVEVFHHTAKFPLHDDDGRPVAVGCIAIDVTESHARAELLREMFDRSPVPSARVGLGDGGGTVLDANAALGALLGVAPASLVGRPFDDLLHPGERDVPLLPADVDRVPLSGGRERRLQRGDGGDVWVRVTAAGIRATRWEPPFALVTLEDITSRRRAEESLTHQALHDMLTGLLNRTALLDRLAAAMGRLWRNPSYAAVLFCDLDGFKHLNDVRGHRAGDEILLVVAERLRRAIRPEDTLARLGGDEFVVVAEGLRTAGEARLVGDSIRAALRAPIRLGDSEFAVTVSIGVATTTDPETRPEDLLRRADLAMYRAKDAGRDRVEFYVAELEQRVVAHLAAQDMLRAALSEDRIVAYFQPVVSLTTGSVVGAEALARLVHPEEGVLPPARFIGEAEESGLVGPLGERMLGLALRQSAGWADAGHRLRIAVNSSPRQLAHAGFAAHVLQLLAESGLDPEDLVIEVTESAVVDASGPTTLALRRLRDHGVHVAIDDFGTGYATLAGLKSLPADIIKIDRAFVSGLVDDPDDAAIVAAVIRVAHDLGRTVVAEGVETLEQQAALMELGCDEAQGFLYSRPVPAADFPVGGLLPGPPAAVRPGRAWSA